MVGRHLAAGDLLTTATTKAVWNTRRLSRSGISCETRLITEQPKLWPTRMTSRKSLWVMKRATAAT